MMDKFGMGTMGLGPLPGMGEAMDFVQRAWSSFNLPSGMTPTLDVDEIDRRIADLRTVEQWLTLNLNMVQSAIQGLEIQRGTLAALTAFGNAVGGSAGLDPTAVARAMATAMAPTRAPRGAGEAPPPPEPAPRPASHRRPDADHATAAAGGSGEGGAAKRTDAPAEAANPAVWWNLLQGQFSQLAQAALAGAAAVAPAFTAAGTEAAGTNAAPAASARTPDAPAARKRPAGKAATRKPGRRPAPPAG